MNFPCVFVTVSAATTVVIRGSFNCLNVHFRKGAAKSDKSGLRHRRNHPPESTGHFLAQWQRVARIFDINFGFL